MTPTEQIDGLIAGLTDWRHKTLADAAALQALVRAAVAYHQAKPRKARG